MANEKIEIGENKKKSNINYEHFFNSVTKRRNPNYLRVAFEALSTLPRNKTFKFSNGCPNPETFAYAEFAIELKDGTKFKIRDQDLEDAFAALNCRGYTPMIKLLQEYTVNLHGYQDWEKKEIALISGAQDGICKILEMCLSEGDAIILQSPLFPGTIEIIRPMNVECLECFCDEYGPCTEFLKKMLENRKSRNLTMPKLMYVISIGSNPTGLNISNKRKAEIYEIACQYNLLILEDDPYFFINFSQTENNISFLKLDTEGRVIRIDSFSKTMGMGLRLGYLTAPKEIIQKVILRQEISSIPSVVTSVILYHTLKFMKFQGFLDHCSKIKQFYLQSRNHILTSLEKYLKDDAEWMVPEGAMFVWIKIKKLDHVSPSLVEKCWKKLVMIAPGFPFYVNNTASPHIRLAYSMMSLSEIEKGIELLSQIVKEEIKSSDSFTKK